MAVDSSGSSLDLWELARIAGEIHKVTVDEIRMVSKLSDEDLAEYARGNLARSVDLEMLTPDEAAQFHGVVESFEHRAEVPAAQEQVRDIFQNISEQEQSASPFALALASIAVSSSQFAGGAGGPVFGFWRTLFKDLAGGIGGGLGGSAGGPGGVVVGAVAGAVAASL